MSALFLPPLFLLPDAHHIAEEAAALGGELHVPVIAAEEPLFVGRLHHDLVEEEVQPVALAHSQHAEIQKLALIPLGSGFVMTRILSSVRHKKSL